MPEITFEEIKNLFALARLPYEAERALAAQKDLSEILGYVANLSRADVSGVEEVHGGTDFLNAFRRDEAIPAAKEIRDATVRSFPRSEADLNKVPSILGK
jgi:aspartyl/glutamyl-tRNA(Asn/Gln) amidotransferase C subunit